MYIDRLGNRSSPDDGNYIILTKEVIEYSFGEFIMGRMNRIIVCIENSHVSVRDCGWGIPLGKVIDSVSTINIDAKKNDNVFHFSVGLNGIST